MERYQVQPASVIGNNIAAAESVFSQVSSQLLNLRNFSLFIVAAIVLAQMYGSLTNIVWRKRIKNCIEFAHNYLHYFLKQDAQKLRLQKIAAHDMSTANVWSVIIFSVAVHGKTVAYFSLS